MTSGARIAFAISTALTNAGREAGERSEAHMMRRMRAITSFLSRPLVDLSSQRGQIRGERRNVLGGQFELRHVRMGALRFGLADPALQVASGQARTDVR